jgi:hypothetical protein
MPSRSLYRAPGFKALKPGISGSEHPVGKVLIIEVGLASGITAFNEFGCCDEGEKTLCFDPV